MKSYRSLKTAVKQSDKGGKGLFAIDRIEKGELVAIKLGQIVTHDQLQAIDDEIRDFSLQITDEFHLSSASREELEDAALFLNHSCDPNVGMDGQISFVAMRDISAGEELCLDYAMVRVGAYRLDCHCGSPHCRGTITGEDWLRQELQKKYKHYFSFYIQKLIDRSQ